jgi:hypothetical protein
LEFLEFEDDVVEFSLGKLIRGKHLSTAAVPSVNQELTIKIKLKAVISIKDESNFFTHWRKNFSIPLDANKVRSLLG